MRRLAYALTAAIGLVGPVSAATITPLNDVSSVGVAPAQVANSLYGNNDGINVAFNERSGVILEKDQTLGGSFIAAGTVVDSHLIYHDRFSGTDYITSMAAYEFSEKILAVVVATGQLNRTHSLFGRPETEYLSAFGFFGLERDERNELVYNDNQLFARLTVNQGFDAVRVLTVTAVPLPAAGFMLLGALGGLGLMRRRRKTAA